jgi:hypothetical protein
VTRIITVRPGELRPFVASLRRLEESITYPLDADAFRIDHGPEYHPFFSEMGDARFVLAVDGDEVLGSLALVWKKGALYFADFKVRTDQRGTGLARRVAFHAARCAYAAGGWSFAFMAAMRGRKGDVTRSGGFLMKLLRPAARLLVYFAPREALARVPEGLRPPGPGLSLSVASPRLLVSTAGKKDLRLVSTGESWPLVHLACGPSAWGSSLGTYLRRCAQVLPAGAIGCFALDERLEDHVKWLEASGVLPGASCTIYASPRAPRAEWVHLATSEI